MRFILAYFHTSRLVLVAVALLFISISDINGQQKRRPNYPALKGHSIQFLPAFFWNTVGMNGEFTLSPSFAVGAYGAYYWGDPLEESSKVQQDYHNPGIDVGVYGKYFWTEYAPEGLHTSLGVHYSTTIYSNGNIKPYSLHKYWVENTPLDLNDQIMLPAVIHATLSFGYQAVVIPKHVIGDIEVGTAHGFGIDSGYRLSLFIKPTLGVVF